MTVYKSWNIYDTLILFLYDEMHENPFHTSRIS